MGIFADDPRVKAAGTVTMMGVEGKRQRMPLFTLPMAVAGFAKVPPPSSCSSFHPPPPPRRRSRPPR